MTVEEILKSEYSPAFDEIRKNMMVVSFFKYGPIGANYKTEKAIDAIKSLEKRLKAYKDTGNTEFLADIANFAMIEFMYPQREKAFYKSTDSEGSPGVHGMGVNEVARFLEDSNE